MDRSRFEAMVAAYGGAPSRWPPSERAAALAFAGTHPSIAAPLLTREQGLDDLMEHARHDAPPSTTLEARLISLATVEAPAGASAAAPRLPGWAAMAAGIALVAGLGLGWSGAALLAEPELGAELYVAAFDVLSEDAGWSLEDTR